MSAVKYPFAIFPCICLRRFERLVHLSLFSLFMEENFPGKIAKYYSNSAITYSDVKSPPPVEYLANRCRRHCT